MLKKRRSNKYTKGIKSKIALSSIFLSSKKSQMEISFGMIFSIILIIAFIGFAIFGIVKFLSFQKEVQIKKFVNDFQNDVDELWWQDFGNRNEYYLVPNNVQKICLENDGDLKIYSKDGDILSEIYKIKHLKIIENSKCIDKESNKINIKIEKKIGESLVGIS